MPFPQSSFARTGRFGEIYPVGRGAVGQVYAALDNLGRRVAVKEALPTAEGFAAFRAKFEKESRLQAALDHPNIVRVHHLEEDPDTRELYLICEYADAGSLAELIEREAPLAEPLAIRLALDLCAALEETERRRIVHRDLKPSNILLFTGSDGALSAKLGDFGIAQDTRQRKTTMLPGTGHPGTPLYMAPEQADVTMLVDTRADIFALGVTLWEMLTGEDYKALLRDGAAPTLATYNPAASLGVAQVIARAVRADREERYQTPRELADDLRRVLQGERLAPQTIRLKPLARPHPHAPLARLGGLGPFVLTAVLLVGSIVVTSALAGVTGLVTGWTTRIPQLSALQPTAVPPWLEPSATPIPATRGDDLFLNLDPTVTPPPDVQAQVGTSVAATATAAALPTPWVEGTAMAGPNGCRAGSGQLASVERPAPGVRAVLLEGVGTLEVRVGAAEALTVTGDDNLLPMIYSYVEGDTLVIGIHGCVQDAAGLRYSLTVPELRDLTITGTAEARLEDLQVDRLTLRLTGVGNIWVSGAVEALTVLIDGNGVVQARELQAGSVEVTISGAGSASVWATQRLDAAISGTGDVEYTGSPRVTETISGIGEVHAAAP